MADMTLMSSRGHSSRSRERTRDRCVPRFLWIPEHSMQIRAPRFRLAQSGSKKRDRWVRGGGSETRVYLLIGRWSGTHSEPHSPHSESFL